MKFDWMTFLRQRGIPYTNAGHTRGNVGVHCPFCGASDKGAHMGIAVDGRGWHCWRVAEHSGIKPMRLIAALVGCSYAEAAKIAGEDTPGAMPSLDDRTFGDAIAAMVDGPRVPNKARDPLIMPSGIRPLGGRPDMFWLYLKNRGYSSQDIPELARRYRLSCAFAGPFRYRIIFPVEHPEGLVTWTGRSISNSAFRYRALSADATKADADQLPQALYSIEHTLWQLKYLTECDMRTLVICEGPFDAMRVDFYGRKYGIAASCLFGKRISDQQAVLLSDLKRFKRRVLLMDPDASIDAWKAVERLALLKFQLKRVPDGVEDPGTLSDAQVAMLAA